MALRAAEIVPAILRYHNTYCSYADVIVPQFFFAVGFALRLVVLKEIERSGQRTAYIRGLKRGFALFLFGGLFYRLDGRGPSRGRRTGDGVFRWLNSHFPMDTETSNIRASQEPIAIFPVRSVKGAWSVRRG